MRCTSVSFSRYPACQTRVCPLWAARMSLAGRSHVSWHASCKSLVGISLVPCWRLVCLLACLRYFAVWELACPLAFYFPCGQLACLLQATRMSLGMLAVFHLRVDRIALVGSSHVSWHASGISLAGSSHVSCRQLACLLAYYFPCGQLACLLACFLYST